MLSLYQNIKIYFNALYSNSSHIYNQPKVADLEHDFERYSLIKRYPDLEQTIQSIFANKVGDVSVEAVLQKLEFKNSDEEVLKQIGFKQLKSKPEVGIILKHTDIPGWLIKKNYHSYKDQNKNNWLIKKVSAPSHHFPSWMLPPNLQQKVKKGGEIGIRAFNGFINPLRVVMLKRGRQWIKKLHLNHLKACKEYLYRLPHPDPQLPRHCRYVVFSKEENLLNQSESLKYFAMLAETRPERLKVIVHQICLFIKHTHLTDMHIDNMRFLDDETDTLVLFDGEPIGAVSEASEENVAKIFEEYDAGFYPLLGLKKLQSSIYDSFNFMQINPNSIEKMQRIFNQEINQISQEIIAERYWHRLKEKISKFSFTKSVLNSVANLITSISERIFSYFLPQAPLLHIPLIDYELDEE